MPDDVTLTIDRAQYDASIHNVVMRKWDWGGIALFIDLIENELTQGIQIARCAGSA